MTCWRALVCCSLLVGCESWPLYHESAEPEPALPSSIDPRSLTEIAWSVFDEHADAAQEMVSLGAGQGVVVTGALEGTGWDPALSPPTITSDACGSSGTARPSATGDYTGDIDFVEFSTSEAATLCVRALFPGAADVGWDALLFPLDFCGVPGEPVAVDGAPVGVDLGGEASEYDIPLPAGRYLLQWSGYDPDDAERVVDYSMGISLLRPNPGGGSDVCPLLPGEIQP
jgi:hypothetical protein